MLWPTPHVVDAPAVYLFLPKPGAVRILGDLTRHMVHVYIHHKRWGQVSNRGQYFRDMMS